MMMMPSIFGENLFDNWMDFSFGKDFFVNRSGSTTSGNVMKTDIKETENGYELDIDIPGYKKEDISAQLENGYLTISAKKNSSNDEKDDKGNYIRRERFYGSASRSFYVGKHITQEDVQAKFENGILKLNIPKKDKREVEEKRQIAIEG